jgi:hypothetical protein
MRDAFFCQIAGKGSTGSDALFEHMLHKLAKGDARVLFCSGDCMIEHGGSIRRQHIFSAILISF